MPHFLCHSKATFPTLPLNEGDFCFMYEAKDINYPNTSLILVRFDNGEFFLRKIKRQNDIIIKCEQKNAPTGIIKNALLSLCKYVPTLQHNLSNNKPRQNLLLHCKDIDFFMHLKKPCLIEIGFGSGRHLIAIAKDNPKDICIGVEIYAPAIEQVCRQIEILGLKNLYIFRGDGRILLEVLHSNIARAIFLHFPVPWNKKPHRRVFSNAFLLESLRVLSPHSKLHLRTDDEAYYNDALAIAQNIKHINIAVRKNAKSAIISKYEARWEKARKDIYDVFISPNETNSQQKAVKNFYFDKILRKNVHNYEHISYKKIEADWFLHIAKIYHSVNKDSDVFVLKLSFGDFNQPQNTFVEAIFSTNAIDEASSCTSVRYVGSKPIPTNAAFMAHKHLVDILRSET